MSDSSSGSDRQRRPQYSTPLSQLNSLSCSISSISDERSSTAKKVLSRPRSNIDYQNEGSDTDGIFGDVVRDHAGVPEDIRSVDMEQLFHRAHDVVSRKSGCQPCPIFKVPAPPKIPLRHILDDDTFDGEIGEHHRTYSRIPKSGKRDLSEKERVPIYSTADFEWESVMGLNTAFYSQKNTKPVENSPIKSVRKFFKSRRHDEDIRSAPEQNRPNNSYVGYSELFMPSLKRPLGWMAIRGIGYAERLKLSNEVENFPEDMLDSIEPIAKRKRNHRLTEYTSPP